MMKTIVFACVIATALAACPNQCSGHGRCGESDKCECYQQHSTPWGQRYGWTGADCSQRTCPLGRAFDSISTLDNRLSGIVYAPAAGGGAGKKDMLKVYLNRDFLTTKNVKYFVRVAKTDANGYQFSWKRDTDDVYSQPVDITASQASTADNAYELKHLESGALVATGVRVHFGVTITVANQLDVGDVFEFIANHNNGIDWDKSDDNTVHQEVECSGRGLCNSGSGRCTCFTGYSGEACQRTTCANNCNGHGVCQDQRRFAADASEVYSKAFDAKKVMGCLCDNGFRGPDCSQIECPSGKDPLRGAGGAEGRDCSGRGLCDYSTGLCKCFKGYFGERCESQTNFV